jgi:hypothetical protein
MHLCAKQSQISLRQKISEEIKHLTAAHIKLSHICQKKYFFTSWSLSNLPVNSPTFLERTLSLPLLQESTTGLIPVPDKASRKPHMLFLTRYFHLALTDTAGVT